MRSITMTRGVHQLQYIAGTRNNSEPSKLRRSWLAFAASRIRSSSSSRWRANSATTWRGFSRRPSAHNRSTRPAAVSSSMTSRATARSTPGRSTRITSYNVCYTKLLRDGREVAIKVLRPGVERAVARDVIV